MFLLPDGETYRDRDTLEASRRAAMVAMEIADEEPPETDKRWNRNLQLFFTSARFYPRFRGGRIFII